MATKDKSAPYQDAKQAFDTLKIEDKAVFLVEAVFSTVLKGMEEFSDSVSDAVDGIFDRRHDQGETETDPPTPAKKKTTRAPRAKKKATGSSRKRAPKKETDE